MKQLQVVSIAAGKCEQVSSQFSASIDRSLARKLTSMLEAIAAYAPDQVEDQSHSASRPSFSFPRRRHAARPALVANFRNAGIRTEVEVVLHTSSPAKELPEVGRKVAATLVSELLNNGTALMLGVRWVTRVPKTKQLIARYRDHVFPFRRDATESANWRNGQLKIAIGHSACERNSGSRGRISRRDPRCRSIDVAIGGLSRGERPSRTRRFARQTDILVSPEITDRRFEEELRRAVLQGRRRPGRGQIPREQFQRFCESSSVLISGRTVDAALTRLVRNLHELAAS